jgi:hypothetical protein
MATLKQLKKLLKKAGLKASGSKRALTRRAKKARLMRGGDEPPAPKADPAQVKANDKTPEGRLAAREEAEAMVAAEKEPPALPPRDLTSETGARSGGSRGRWRRMPRAAYVSVRTRRRGFF